MGNLNSSGKRNRRRKNKQQLIVEEENNKLNDSFDLAEIDYKSMDRCSVFYSFVCHPLLKLEAYSLFAAIDLIQIN